MQIRSKYIICIRKYLWIYKANCGPWFNHQR